MSRALWLVASSIALVFGVALLSAPFWMPFDVEDELLEHANQATDYGRTESGNGTLFFAGYENAFTFGSGSVETWNGLDVMSSVFRRVIYTERARDERVATASESESNAWVVEYDLTFDPESGDFLEARIKTPYRELTSKQEGRFETTRDNRLLWHRSILFRTWVLLSGALSSIAACVIAGISLRQPRGFAAKTNGATSHSATRPAAVVPPMVLKRSTRPSVPEPSFSSPVAPPASAASNSPAPSPVATSPKHDVGPKAHALGVDALVDELVRLVGTDGGFAQAERIREIGELLNAQGGMEKMQEAYYLVRRRGVYFSQDIWHMIGDWRN